MHGYVDSKRRYFTVEDMIPYFQSRARQKRICPECHSAALTVRPTSLNPNAAFDYCSECHYFQVILAPEEAQVPYDWMPPHRRKCKIVRFEDLKRRG
jgi:hypothetical protein